MEETYLVAESSELTVGPFLYAEEKDAVFVTGQDAISYLQGQLTKDVIKLLPGQSVNAFLLEPKGEVSCFVNVKKMSENSFILTTDKSFGPSLFQRLAKFKIRVKADIIADSALSLLLFHADYDRDISQLASSYIYFINSYMKFMTKKFHPDNLPTGLDAKTYISQNSLWRNLKVFELILPGCGADFTSEPSGVQLPQLLEEFLATQVFIKKERYEFLRICSGIPKMGFEIKNKVLPLSLGIADVAIDYDKGCYTGQELVARLDARGNNTPSVLKVAVRVHREGSFLSNNASDVKLHIGDSLFFEDMPAGTLTSVACFENMEVGLAFIKREFSSKSSTALFSVASHNPIGTGDPQVNLYEAPFSGIPSSIFRY